MNGLRAAIAALLVFALPTNVCAAARTQSQIESVVAQTIRPLMQRYAIPGMAVGVIVDGHTYVFNYGVASLATQKPVAGDTLFEIGSVSKAFTATLAAYAQFKRQAFVGRQREQVSSIPAGQRFRQREVVPTRNAHARRAALTSSGRRYERRAAHGVLPELEAGLRTGDVPDVFKSQVSDCSA